MIELIEQTINKIDDLIKEQLPGSKYQFELYDLITNTKHFRGYDEPFHWGSVYKLFIVAEIIKMVDNGQFKPDEKIVFDKSLYKNGVGIIKYFTNLNELTLIDCCKMIFAISDNVCADELLGMIGLSHFNLLFEKAECTSSKLSANLDTLISNLFADLNLNETNAFYYHSTAFYEYFDVALNKSLIDNHTNVRDLNKCWHFIMTKYLSPNGVKLFKNCFQLNNVHSRFTEYTAFADYILYGKTGTLGLGIVNNEIAAITHKNTNEIYGYISLLTKDNTKRYFQSSDVLGLIGLEIVNLYEQLNK